MLALRVQLVEADVRVCLHEQGVCELVLRAAGAHDHVRAHLSDTTEHWTVVTISRNQQHVEAMQRAGLCCRILSRECYCLTLE